MDTPKQTAWRYNWQNRRQAVYALMASNGLALVFAVLFTVLALRSGGGTIYIFAGTLTVLGVIIADAIWVAQTWAVIGRTLVADFARAHGYSFHASGELGEEFGALFRIQGVPIVSNILEGTYEGMPMKLFLYALNGVGGPMPQGLVYTVFEADASAPLPRLLITSRKGWMAYDLIITTFGSKNALRLDKGFDNQFNSYAEEADSPAISQIISQDVMTTMESSTDYFAVELAGKKIYLYVSGSLRAPDQITRALTIVKKICSGVEFAGGMRHVPPLTVQAAPSPEIMVQKFRKQRLVILIVVAICLLFGYILVIR